jgi:AcrR family transcriptional regulator
MNGSNIKIPAEIWIETARKVLIEEGISGVKVDRLAKRLGVTRGGFFHYFRDREVFLKQLLVHWQKYCKFFPVDTVLPDQKMAKRWVRALAKHLIDETDYDHRFDMAVREWARSSPDVRRAVDQVDVERLAVLKSFYRIMGYVDVEADVRSRVFYYHQIGYYAIDVRELPLDRMCLSEMYLEILCGDRFLLLDD